MTTLGKLGFILASILGFALGFSIGGIIPGIIFFIIFNLVYFALSFRRIMEYERGLYFILGKYGGLAGPGPNFIFPFVEELRKVSLRVEVADAPPQEIITQDNIPLNINAVAYYRVENPEKAILNVENYHQATFQYAQTTIRSVVGQHEMDEVLAHRDEINHKIKAIIDDKTDDWGIKIEMVELKDVELPQNLKRAMAKQAEAERERRARVILATGELEASETLARAGEAVAKQAGAMQLRLLQTLQEVSAEKNSTIIFPLPIELAKLYGFGEQ